MPTPISICPHNTPGIAPCDECLAGVGLPRSPEAVLPAKEPEPNTFRGMRVPFMVKNRIGEGITIISLMKGHMYPLKSSSRLSFDLNGEFLGTISSDLDLDLSTMRPVSEPCKHNVVAPDPCLECANEAMHAAVPLPQVVDVITPAGVEQHTVHVANLRVTPKNAEAVQIGGDHYRKLNIQPMRYSMENKLDACQHTAIKYITRFRDKGGIADLEKAKHVIDLLIQFEQEKTK